MAKVKVGNLTTVFNAVKSIFEDSIGRAEFLSEIKDFSILRIQAETRKGKDLTREGNGQPALSEGYVRWRRRLAAGKSKSGIKPDSKFFRPAKSNLTLTGQMLESLSGNVRERKRQIEVFVTENRNDGESNKEIVSDLKKRGRAFLGMDQKGIKLIRRRVLDEIRRKIRQKGFT